MIMYNSKQTSWLKYIIFSKWNRLQLHVKLVFLANEIITKHISCSSKQTGPHVK